jgi:hypothetical protein
MITWAIVIALCSFGRIRTIRRIVLATEVSVSLRLPSRETGTEFCTALRGGDELAPFERLPATANYRTPGRDDVPNIAITLPA